MQRSLFSLVKHQSSSRILHQTVKLHTSPPCQSLLSTNKSLPDIVSAVTDQLEAANVPDPRLSADYLLSCSLSSRSTRVSPVLARDWEQHNAACLTESQLINLQTLVQCRLSHVPLQYIVGNWDFRNITLQCRPPVFIPRPETEQLVDIILSHVLPDRKMKLLEVGPGTGAVCLSLLQESSSIESITCVERSKAAVELTRDNAEMLGLADRVELVLGRVGVDDDSLGLDTGYDLIYSNPPYILRKDLPKLAPQIALYEDLRALDGGAEGLDVIMSILELAGTKLESGGSVILEVDPCHPLILPPKLEELKHTFIVKDVIKDFTQRDRFMVIEKT